MLTPSKGSTAPVSADLRDLLVAARGQDHAALDALFERVYGELHGLAHRQLVQASPGDTLSTTALVHETYIKLSESLNLDLHDRRHLLATAARAMRQIIVDYARRSQAQKRGGAMIQLPAGGLDRAPAGNAGLDLAELVALDTALLALEALNSRLSQVVELRFFGGLSIEETAELLEVSPRTVKRDWRKARAYLFHALGGPTTL